MEIAERIEAFLTDLHGTHTTTMETRRAALPELVAEAEAARAAQAAGTMTPQEAGIAIGAELMAIVKGDAMDIWNAELEKLEGVHGPIAMREFGRGFNTGSRFDPAKSRITDVETDGHRAVAQVMRVADPAKSASYSEITLERGDSGWVITDHRWCLTSPHQPMFTAEEIAERDRHASTDAPLDPLGPTDRQDFTVLLEAAQHIGEFDHSGVLAIADPAAYFARSWRILDRAIRPGRAYASFSQHRDRISSFMVSFAPVRPVRWARAASGGHTGAIDVDAARVAVLDWAQLRGVTARAFEDVRTPPAIVDSAMAEVGSRTIGALTTSGWGDGGYPVYWGLGPDDHPVMLLVDYGVAPGAPWAEPDDYDGEELYGQ